MACMPVKVATPAVGVRLTVAESPSVSPVPLISAEPAPLISEMTISME